MCDEPNAPFQPEHVAVRILIQSRLPTMPLADGTSALSSSDLTTILLVDDDDSLRRIARRVLTRAGYRVLDSSNGIDALRLLDQMTHAVDVVLSDMVMPGMGGRDLAREVCTRFPAARLVLMSGYPRAVLGTSDPMLENAVFVQKPFTPVQLLQGIRAALLHVGSS